MNTAFTIKTRSKGSFTFFPLANNRYAWTGADNRTITVGLTARIREKPWHAWRSGDQGHMGMGFRKQFATAESAAKAALKYWAYI